MEQIYLAIQQLVEKKKKRKVERGDEDQEEDEELILLSNLLSQLESVKEGNTPTVTETLVGTKKSAFPATIELETNDETRDETGGQGSKEKELAEIVKEIKQVKKQNSITHWLLSTMIVLTAAWQLSEFSVMMKVRNTINHPFRSVQDMITGVLKGGRADSRKGGEENGVMEIEPPHLPALKIPELPHMDLPVLGLELGEE